MSMRSAKELIIFTVALGLWLAMCYGMGYIAMHFILKYWYEVNIT